MANIAQPLTVNDPGVDWNAIRQRYLQGMPLPAISAEFSMPPHSIRARADREGWRFAKEQALIIARQEISEEIKGRLLGSVLNDSRRACWEECHHPPHSEEYDKYSRGRERLINSAARLCGWDTEQRNPDSVGIAGAPVIDIRAKVLPTDASPSASTPNSDASDAQPANPG